MYNIDTKSFCTPQRKLVCTAMYIPLNDNFYTMFPVTNLYSCANQSQSSWLEYFAKTLLARVALQTKTLKISGIRQKSPTGRRRKSAA